MYQATAEIVDGSKVFAGGKWLTCIGNKNVRVGDRIWTDGRCVYGYNQESQSPIVITPPVKEEFGIPILFSNGQAATYCQNRLIFHDAKFTPKTRYPYGYINSYASGGYVAHTFNLNYRADRFFNVDDAGNIFDAKLREYPKDCYNIVIKKNGDIIKTLDLTPLASAAIAYTDGACEQYLRRHIFGTIGQSSGIRVGYTSPGEDVDSNIYVYDGGYDNDFTVTIEHGFIENENDWNFIIRVYSESHGAAGIYLEPKSYFFLLGSYPAGGFGAQAMYMYHFSNKGTTPLLNITSKSLEAVFTPANINIHDYQIKSNTNNVLDVSIPMPDGFYYKTNYFIGLDDEEIPGRSNITIFSPNGENIFTGIFYLLPEVLACKVGTSYLIKAGGGVMDYADYYYTAAENEALHRYFYKVKHNQAELLTTTAIHNRRLRPMKHYKRWWNNIQTLE